MPLPWRRLQQRHLAVSRNIHPMAPSTVGPCAHVEKVYKIIWPVTWVEPTCWRMIWLRDCVWLCKLDCQRLKCRFGGCKFDVSDCCTGAGLGCRAAWLCTTFADRQCAVFACKVGAAAHACTTKYGWRGVCPCITPSWLVWTHLLQTLRVAFTATLCPIQGTWCRSTFILSHFHVVVIPGLLYVLL